MRLNRRLTFSEELGNTITHGVMAAATLVLLPIGSLWGYFHGGYAAATGISIFYYVFTFNVFELNTLSCYESQ